MRSYLSRVVMAAFVGLTLSVAHAQQTSTIIWDDEPTTGTRAGAPAGQSPAAAAARNRSVPASGPEGGSYANQWGSGEAPDTGSATAPAESRNIYNDVRLSSEPSEVRYSPAGGGAVTDTPRRSRFEWAGESREQISRPRDEASRTREIGGDDPFRPYVDPEPSDRQRNAIDRANQRNDDSFRPYVDPE